VAPAGAHASLRNRAVRPGRVQITCRARGRLRPVDGAVRQTASPQRSGRRGSAGVRATPENCERGHSQPFRGGVEWIAGVTTCRQRGYGRVPTRPFGAGSQSLPAGGVACRHQFRKPPRIEAMPRGIPGFRRQRRRNSCIPQQGQSSVRRVKELAAQCVDGADSRERLPDAVRLPVTMACRNRHARDAFSAPATAWPPAFSNVAIRAF